MTALGTIRQRADAHVGAAIAIDREGRVVFCNDAAGRLLARPADRVPGLRLESLLEIKDVFANRTCADFCGLWEMAARDETMQRFCLALGPAGETVPRRFIVDAEVVEGSEEPGSGPHLLLLLLPDRRRSPDSAGRGGMVEDHDTRAVDLTRRQAQILRLLANGRSSAEIAGVLSISVNTVRKHVQASLGKLGARSQAHAVAVALRLNLL